MLQLLKKKFNTISTWGVKDFLKVRTSIKKEEEFSQSSEILKYYKVYSTKSQPNSDTASLSIIIPTRNIEYISEIVNQLTKLLGRSKRIVFEIIVLNNFNKSITKKIFPNEIDITIIDCDFPFNFSKINNLGVAESMYDIIWFLNDDIRLDHFSEKNLLAMIQIAKDPKVGAVGNILLYPDGKIQHGGVSQRYWVGGAHIYRFQDPKLKGSNANEWTKIDHIVDAVTGASLMIEKEKFQKVEGFNEELPVDFNDVELCKKLRKNNYINIVNSSKLLHLESATRKKPHEGELDKSFVKAAKILLK